MGVTKMTLQLREDVEQRIDNNENPAPCSEEQPSFRNLKIHPEMTEI